jgi:hypothetical protein
MGLHIRRKAEKGRNREAQGMKLKAYNQELDRAKHS